ncbi:hypothetical protein CICLE_v10005082mg [Citrus x clementina]|uniref:Protein kinase domain-containing protein n=1 Tax=Citrus clementina TaxID=85681 RepID=V4S7L1_CITCL|nr:uncharacterized protein LOC18031459 [Citrus x clementina]XP_052290307.1 uncharacterized protein LOC102624458 [Citrus sinensis]ESR34815.1 hypothetical protein CICLE_v10005082mg [Citrus x clementina]GAY47405.1 hypothetical protein CUMW_104330 [Citrus unshiu]
MHNFLVLGGTFTNRRHCEKEKKEEKMRSEFDRDCEIGMLEENVLPLGSGLRAPIRGALGIILGHKTAGLNIFVGASKFLLHHVEEGLLNQRLLENVVTCDLKCLCRQAGFEEKLSYPNQVKPLGYCWKDKWPRKESLENHLFRRTEGNLETKENKDCIYMDIFVVIIELPGFAESFSIKEGSWDKKIEIAIGVAKTLVAMQSSEKQNIYRDLKPSSILLKETPKSLLADTPHNSVAKVSLMDGSECTALDISDDLSQSAKTEMKIKATQHVWGAFGAKYDRMRKVFKWGHLSSHLQNTWLNMKTKNKSKGYVFHLLLLLALLSTITFHIALKIFGCRSEKGFQQISSLNPFCRVVNRHPHLFQLLITLNSAAFFLCLAFMTVLFNEFPLKPLLLVSVFSMLAAYMCII